jgi:hypothetical protein
MKIRNIKKSVVDTIHCYFFSLSLFVFRVIMEGPFHLAFLLTKYVKVDQKFLKRVAAFLISTRFFNQDH